MSPVVELVAFFVVGVLGFGGGLVWYHFNLGWFLSWSGQPHLEDAVGEAERLLLRRARRRLERESNAARRARLVAEVGGRRGRHLARSGRRG